MTREQAEQLVLEELKRSYLLWRQEGPFPETKLLQEARAQINTYEKLGMLSFDDRPSPELQQRIDNFFHNAQHAVPSTMKAMLDNLGLKIVEK